MKKIFTLCAFLCAAITAGNAGEIVLCDFENYNVGDAFTMVNIYGPTTSTAEVVADPLNPDNKVLHVKVDKWNTFVQFVLPEGITGKNLLDNYQKVSFDLYRAADQTNDHMQTAVLLGPSTDGSTTLYWDSDFPFLGDKGKWIPKSYDFNRIYNESTTLLLGLHCDVVEYYIDNVRLSGVSSVETDTIHWTASVSNVWDEATTNFSALEDDPATGTPVAFASGNRVIFDDNVLTTATATPTTVQVSGTMEASTVVFDNTELDYTLTAADGEAALTGAGQFIVQGGGSVTVGVNNQFLKGTYLKDGELRMGVQNGNVLGTSLLTEGGTLYTCFDNSSDSYVSVSTPMTMAEGTALDVYLSRYAYWMSSLSGNGTLNIYAGGERSHLGNEKGAKYPDWNGFSGTVNVYPYKEVVSTAGFYGVILGHGGKTFNPAEIEESLSSGKVNTMFENSVLVLHDGTALACESGTRAFRIGELQMSPTSRIYGYFKASSPSSYFLVGCSGTDSELSGQIAPPEKNGKPYIEQTLGIIKEGTGTYTLTNNNNLITGGIQVLGGKLLVNNDVKKTESEGLTGGTGYAKEGTLVFVFEGATIGGTGNIADDVDVYGRLEPGSNGIGTLTLKNFASDDSVSLYLRPTTEMEFEIASPTHHDSLIVDGHLVYYNQTQDFMESDEKPVVRIKIDDSYVYNEGDEFVLISYKGKSSLWGDPWDFNVKLPDTEKWAVEERTTETGKQFVLVAKSTSGVKSTESEDRVRIYTQSGNICVESEAGDVIRLYSTSGQLLKSETARQGLTLIEALPGTYVIEVAGQSTTIVNY